MAGVQNFFGGLYHQAHRQPAHHNGHLNAGQHSGLHPGPPEVALGLAPLFAAAHDVDGSHAGDADVEHGPLQGIEPLHLAENVHLGHLDAGGSGYRICRGSDHLHRHRLLHRDRRGGRGGRIQHSSAVRGIVIGKGKAAIGGGQAVLGDVQSLDLLLG